MKILIKSCFFTALFAVILGCAYTPTNNQPNWIDNPKRHQAVGSCGAHALGKYKQKECAMTRARLELAARQGVEIKSLSIMSEQANNMRSFSTLNQQTVQEVNSKIKARLVDSYHDKGQDILWVLMEEN
jgi:hypothetical protein